MAGVQIYAWVGEDGIGDDCYFIAFCALWFNVRVGPRMIDRLWPLNSLRYVAPRVKDCWSKSRPPGIFPLLQRPLENRVDG